MFSLQTYRPENISHEAELPADYLLVGVLIAKSLVIQQDQNSRCRLTSTEDVRFHLGMNYDPRRTVSTQIL